MFILLFSYTENLDSEWHYHNWLFAYSNLYCQLMVTGANLMPTGIPNLGVCLFNANRNPQFGVQLRKKLFSANGSIVIKARLWNCSTELSSIMRWSRVWGPLQLDSSALFWCSICSGLVNFAQFCSTCSALARHLLCFSSSLGKYSVQWKWKMYFLSYRGVRWLI